MDSQELKQKALAIIKRAAETKTNIIRIRIRDATNIYFHFDVNNTYELQEVTHKEFGSELCRTIYQAMTTVADTSLRMKHQQFGKITRNFQNGELNVSLPENVISIDVKTYPNNNFFDMLLFIKYEWSEDNTDEEIATDLAIKFIEELKEPIYITNSTLDIVRPETLHNFVTLKRLLMKVHEQGFARGAKLGNIPS